MTKEQKIKHMWCLLTEFREFVTDLIDKRVDDIWTDDKEFLRDMLKTFLAAKERKATPRVENDPT